MLAKRNMQFVKGVGGQVELVETGTGLVKKFVMMMIVKNVQKI